MRRLAAFISLFTVGAGSLAPGLLDASTAAAASLAAGGCQPTITSWTTFHQGADPGFTLNGTCFGTSGAFTSTDSPHFGVVVFPPGTPLAQMKTTMQGQTVPHLLRWSACSTEAGLPYQGPNGVNCTVDSWANTSITLSAFTGSLVGKSNFPGFPDNFQYDYVVKNGDHLALQVWNAQTSAGPATLYLTVGAPGSAAGNGEVSSIASTLATPSDAFRSVKSLAIDAAITLLIALFITFPANLFNSTFQENYEDIKAWWDKWTGVFFPVAVRRQVGGTYHKVKDAVLGRLNLAGPARDKRLERDQLKFALVLLLGALLGSMLDPSFGVNTRTVLSFVAIVVAMVAGVVLSALVTVGYHRARKFGSVPFKLEALPVGLAIAAVCVIISRATNFQPGYLYGVICGVAFSRQLQNNEEGHVIALGSWVKLFLALVAWLAWSAITHDASKPGSFFGTVLLDDFLASLFISNLVGQVISLLPLKFLPGHKLQSWHKGAWAVTFLVSLFVLVQVLLRPHSTSSGPSHTPLVTTIVLFALFAAGSLLFREHFVRKQRRQAAGTAPEAATNTVSTGPEATGVITLRPPGAAIDLAGQRDDGQRGDPTAGAQAADVMPGGGGPAPEHP